MLRQLTRPVTRDVSTAAGLAAIAFASLIVLGNAVLVPAGLPRTGAQLADVRAFFGEHGQLVGVGSALTPAAWVAATLFGAGALAVLRRDEREPGTAWALFGFAGLVLQNAAFTGVIALRLALASSGGDAAPALWPLHDTLFTLNGTFLAVALTGLSLAGLQAGLVRPWLARLGLASAALQFTSATLTPLVVDHDGPLGLLGLTGWLLWVIWLVSYGITLIRLTPDRQATGATEEPAVPQYPRYS